MMFKEQAEKCRRQADEFAGRPEGPFLLRVASVFDELEFDRASAGGPAHQIEVQQLPRISA